MGERFPQQYGQHGCILLPIDATLAPHVAGTLRRLEDRGYWQSDDDHMRGYNALAELYIAMSNNCLDELIEAQNRIYRLLDTTINGTEYTATEIAGSITISPAIPAAPPVPAVPLAARLRQLAELVDNATTGAIYNDSGLLDGESTRDVLRQVVDAVQQYGDLDDDQLAKLVEIAALLA